MGSNRKHDPVPPFWNILQELYLKSIKFLEVTLKIPAMDKVKLDVQETSRNSEKLRPNASRPPLHRVTTA